MKYRTNADIDIKRTVGSTETTVATVPITASSKRTWRLMEEDSITLVFTLAEPVELRVGDYITDELFGTFRLREKPMPQYQKTNGGYDYTVRFDAFYWQWERFLFMLTAIPKNQTESGRYRKEASWMLTATLKEHVFEAIRNVRCFWTSALPYEAAHIADKNHICLQIHGTASKAEEVRFLAYDGVKICSALTQMANEYECEWWVTVGTPDTESSFLLPEDTSGWQSGDYIIIHFGKCETGENPLPLRLGYNVEEMIINRNSSQYANRLYIMGGTKNIPESYRRSLTFNAHAFSPQTRTAFNDTAKTITRDVVSGVEVFEHSLFAQGTENQWRVTSNADSDFDPDTGITYWTTTVKTKVDSIQFLQYKADGVYKFSGHLCDVAPSINWSNNDTRSAKLIIVVSLVDSTGESFRTLYYFSENVTKNTVKSIYPVNVSEQNSVPDSMFGISIYASLESTAATGEDPLWVMGYNDTFSYGGLLNVTKTPNNIWLPVIFNETNYWTLFSFDEHIGWNLTFVSGQGSTVETSFPTGFAEGSEFTIPYYDGGDEDGLLVTKIPFSWFVSDYDDPSSLITIDERRLMLPASTGGFIQSVEEDDDIIEMTVKSDDIYPKCYLRVTEVTSEERSQREEKSDGTSVTWTWLAYTVKVENINGDPFLFNRNFIKEGEKLEAVFISEIDEEKAYEEQELEWESHDGYLLAGMTFDVSFDGSQQTYTIVRNDSFGAKLPNDILFPKVGDTFVLTGWDVKAMESLGLIEAAESQLLAFGTEYLQAIEEDQFTFECTMMSDWPWLLYGGDGTGLKALLADEEVDKALHSSDGKTLFGRDRKAYGSLPMYESGNAPLYEVNGKQIYCVNDTYFRLPEPGARVAVYHDALKGTKETRIIGFEYKLDIPYDTPHITVGETEAYSRLKQLEKKITKK